MKTLPKKFHPTFAKRSAKQLQLITSALVIQIEGSPTKDVFSGTISDIEYLLKKVKLDSGMMET
jgi:hypothetical protein